MDAIRFFVCVAALMLAHTPAAAQQYPAKPVRMVVGFAAGGATDISARALALKLSEISGQQVIVDNRPGASSNLAAEIVARSAPDGYSALLANATIAMPTLFVKLPFDVQKDLRPVSLVGYGPLALTAHPSLPVKSVKELIAFAKARPGELNHGSGGSGTGPHLAMELLMQRTGMKLVHITYKGGGPALIDFIAGHTQVYMTNIVTMLPQAKAGKARALATSGATRSTVMPEVPTIVEAGVPDFSEGAFHGVLAPAGVPKSHIERLHAEIVKAMRSPEVLNRLTAEGAEVVASSPQEFQAKIRGDVEKWAKTIKQAGIRLE